MESKVISISVSPSIGVVSAEYLVPEQAFCIMTLAHGAGAGMNHSFMVSIAHALAAKGIATLRFNFPFIEHHKKRTDQPVVAHATIEAAMLHAAESFPALPLFVAGKSFGGRMSSQYLALTSSSCARGIIFYGFPLHPDGKPSIERATHLKGVTIPMLFLQGTKDALATMELIEEVCDELPDSTLIKIEAADHGFKAGKKDILSLLVSETVDWINGVLPSPK